MLPLILEQAILATQSAPAIPSVDGLAYYSNINLAVTCFQDVGGELTGIRGDLTEISKDTRIYQRPVFQYRIDDEFHHITVATIIINKSIPIDMYKYFRQSLGTHNDNKNIDTYFDGKTANFLIPFELVSLAKVGSIPASIGAEKAFRENPLHPCFYHKLIPSPVAGVAVHGNLDNMMGFVVHPNLLSDALDMDLSNESKQSLHYDTKNALKLLNLRYGIHVNNRVVDALEKLDDDIVKVNGTAYIDIEGTW